MKCAQQHDRIVVGLRKLVVELRMQYPPDTGFIATLDDVMPVRMPSQISENLAVGGGTKSQRAGENFLHTEELFKDFAPVYEVLNGIDRLLLKN